MNVSLNSHGTQSKARPFDALSPEEIRQGVSLLKPFVGEEATFVSVCLEAVSYTHLTLPTTPYV